MTVRPEDLALALYDAQSEALDLMFPDASGDRRPFDLIEPETRTLRIETAAAFLASGWKVTPP